MPNPLFNSINTNMQQPSMNDLINDPNKAIRILAERNPQLFYALKSGGNPEMIVRQICQQKGIDVNQFMNNLFGNIRR